MTPDTLAQQVAVHRAHVIADDEALAVVQRIAPRLARESAERDAQRRLPFAELSASGLLGIYLESEAHAKHVQDYGTRLTSTSDGDFVLNGVKHYSTGVLFAHWIGPQIHGATAQVLHAAIDAGIAAGELAVRLRSAEAVLAAAARSIDAARADLNDDTDATRVPTPSGRQSVGDLAHRWGTGPARLTPDLTRPQGARRSDPRAATRAPAGCRCPTPSDLRRRRGGRLRARSHRRLAGVQGCVYWVAQVFP